MSERNDREEDRWILGSTIFSGDPDSSLRAVRCTMVVMARLWFAAKRCGWGWCPCSIEGWVITFVAASGIGMNVAMGMELAQDVDDVLTYVFLPVLLIVAGLLCICLARGEAPR